VNDRRGLSRFPARLHLFRLRNVACGLIATDPFRASADLCPLLSESDHPVADERGQRIAALARALVAGNLQRIELAGQIAEGDRHRRGARD
jgi:hypothetical protein